MVEVVLRRHVVLHPLDSSICIPLLLSCALVGNHDHIRCGTFWSSWGLRRLCFTWVLVQHADWAFMKHLFMGKSTHGSGLSVVGSCNTAFRENLEIIQARVLTFVDGCCDLGLTTEGRLVGISSNTTRMSHHSLLGAAVDKAVDPVVLEFELAWVKSLGLGDHFNFLVVVRSAAVGCDHCPFEVRVLEVHTRIVLNWTLALSLALCGMTFQNHLC